MEFLKNAIVFLLLLCGINAEATIYYFAQGGNDNTNTGTNSSSPWKTLEKLNSTPLNPGDIVRFNRGDTWYGTINANYSGQANAWIYYEAYGIGPKPIITGFTTPTGWTSYATNVFRAPVNNGGNRINVLTLNGVSQAMGRYPLLTPGYGGYAHIDSRSPGTITSTALVSRNYMTPFAGEVVIRKVHHIIERFQLTGHNGTTGQISFSDPGDYYDQGNGFFIQNNPACLTSHGDWAYDKTGGYLYIYLNPGTNPAQYDIKVTTGNELFKIFKRNYNSVNEIDFEGANNHAVDINGDYGAGFSITNSTIQFAGGAGLHIIRITGNTITGNTIRFNSNEGINSFYEAWTTNCSNNWVDNSGMLPGNGMNGGGGGGIAFSITTNTTINDNVITNSGYCPLSLFGGRIYVYRNRIENFNLITDDGGGIYFQRRGNDNDFTTYDTCFIKYNTIINGLGNAQGIATGELWGDGLYSDDRVNKVVWEYNQVYNCSRYGSYTHTSFDQVIRFNSFVHCGVAIGAEPNGAEFDTITIHGMTIKKNTVVTYNSNELVYRWRSEYPDKRANGGIIDSNYIYQLNTGAATFHTSRKETGGSNGYGKGAPAYDYFLNINQWRSLGGNYDVNTPNTGFTANGQTLFVYNSTGSPVNSPLPGIYSTLAGAQYSGLIPVPPYSSFVMQYIGPLPVENNTPFTIFKTRKKNVRLLN